MKFKWRRQKVKRRSEERRVTDMRLAFRAWWKVNGFSIIRFMFVESSENFILVRIIAHGLQSMGTYLNFLEDTGVYTGIISTQIAATLRF
jgi:hypothetical protein